MPIRTDGVNSSSPVVTPQSSRTDGAAASAPGATVRNNSTVGAPTVDATGRVSGGPQALKKAAVAELRRLVKTGELRKYYDAAIGKTNEPALAAKAMKLFESLPKLNGNARVEDLVDVGLWTVAPRGVDQMLESPRYLPGRRVLVRTSLNPDLFATKDFLTYLAPDKGGKQGVTSRATLVGEKGGSFLVAVDGRDQPIEVPKQEVYQYNHPNTFEERGNPDKLLVAGGGHVFGRCDYNDPLTKAKVCEAAIKLDEIVGQIDFAKALKGDVMGKSKDAKQTVELQRKCLRAVQSVIDMEYYKSTAADQLKADFRPHASRVSAGRSAIRGAGKCHDHASVNLAILNPFARMLGMDVKMYYGHCYRAHERGDNPFEYKPMKSGESTGHSWLHIDFRPALNDPRVSDQTWNQPDFEADRAYTSRWGDRYPNRNWFRPAMVDVSKSDVDCSGKITCETNKVLFGNQGDGRDNHISSRLSSLFGRRGG